VGGGVERQANQSLSYEGQNHSGASEVKARFGENGLAGEKGFGHLACQIDRPMMVSVSAIAECY
jgi:hypothetical protein